MIFKKIPVYCVLIFFAVLPSAKAGFNFYFEGAYAGPRYSDISIPKSDGTKFSLTDDLNAENLFAWRTEARWRIDKKHGLELLAAPLEVNATGVLKSDIKFNGETFSKGSRVDGLFRFDSYRLRYRYYFKKSKFFLKSCGLTGKIRDAEIALETTGEKSAKLNTGFVPLINFIFKIPLNQKINFILKGDALFSKFGRAEDIAASFNYDLNKDISLNTGYRVVEGGSDIEEVYSFTWINYYFLGMEFKI